MRIPFRKEFSGFDGFEGKKLAIVGDVMHSRVARSNIELWTKLGAEVDALWTEDVIAKRVRAI